MILERGELNAGSDALTTVEAKYPLRTDLRPIVQAQLRLLPTSGTPGEGTASAEAIVTDGIKREMVNV